MKKYQFVVTLKLKPGNRITKAQARNYVRDAVQDYKGCYHLDSPEFELNHRQFTVKPIKNDNQSRL